MVLPPPNVTGVLHMGHALCFTLPDIIVRWKKMQGYNTMWLPGTDHASIAVHNVIEQSLKEKGLSREKSAGKSSFVWPGNGRRNMAELLPSSSNAWDVLWTGRGKDLLSTKVL